MSYLKIILLKPLISAPVDIFLMLLGAALIGFLVAWLLRSQKVKLLRHGGYQMQKEIASLVDSNDQMEIKLMKKREQLEELQQDQQRMVSSEELEKLQKDLRSEREKSATARNSLAEIERAHDALKEELNSKLDQMISADEATRLRAETNRLKIFNSSLQEEIALLKSQLDSINPPKMPENTVPQVEIPKPVEFEGSSSPGMKQVDQVDEPEPSFLQEHPNLDFLDQVGIKRVGADQRDDLKLISGVGPFIEQKLNHLGIYSFEQIASLSSTQVDQITEAIEFFPGRIERDDWVGQAQNLMS